jgi:hypothetical protein
MLLSTSSWHGLPSHSPSTLLSYVLIIIRYRDQDNPSPTNPLYMCVSHLGLCDDFVDCEKPALEVACLVKSAADNLGDEAKPLLLGLLDCPRFVLTGEVSPPPPDWFADLRSISLEARAAATVPCMTTVAVLLVYTRGKERGEEGSL